ncbi:hypothetical protein JYT84_00550 [bacterium AH-315-M10]|nr:hypothetical protein [bacterium AH-315-M10]
MTTDDITEEQPSSVRIVVRIPADLAGRVDRYAEALGQRVEGVRVTRSDAVRALLTAALEQQEQNGEAS